MYSVFQAPIMTVGENIEELFSRIAVVAFENMLMKEVEAEATPPPSNGQLAKNSTLIGNNNVTAASVNK